MALPGLTQHRKFGRLARALGSRVTAMGVLQLLWDHCYETVSAEIGDVTDLAYVVDWPGDGADLAGALVDAGFLELAAPGRYVVHDLWDHAPEYVHKRRQRLEARRARGQASRPDMPPPAAVRPPDGRQVAADRPPDGDDPPPDGRRAADTLSCPISPVSPVSKNNGLRPSSPPAGQTNWRAIAKIGFDLFGRERFDNEADRKDALKTEAAKHGLPFTPGDITRVLDLIAHTTQPRRAPMPAASRPR